MDQEDPPMHVSVSDAKARLTDLVRRAEAGEDVVLTRRGQPAVRLVRAEPPRLTDDERWKKIEALQGSITNKPGLEDVTAATIADFLYDERGLPV